jgi:hypothetical protein
MYFVDRPLPQEGVAQHSASFQLLPEQQCSQGAVVPKFSRTLFKFRVVVKHDLCFVFSCRITQPGHPPTPPSKGESRGATPCDAVESQSSRRRPQRDLRSRATYFAMEYFAPSDLRFFAHRQRILPRSFQGIANATKASPGWSRCRWA